MHVENDYDRSMVKNKFTLRLKGKTIVIIDWANVYGWRSQTNGVTDPKKLYKYLNGYREISFIHFYYGLDKHPKSKTFLQEMKRIGYTVISKEVKYIPVSLDTSHFKKIFREMKSSLILIKGIKTKDLEKVLKILERKIMRRKCDFDIEIAMDVYKHMDEVDTFVFFSGDGDFAPLFEFLISKGKQVIVVFEKGHLGREIIHLNKKLFLCPIKNIPSIARRA